MDDMNMPARILYRWDQSAEMAESIAKELAYSYSVKDCSAEEEAAFRAWLAGDTDEIPAKMPTNKYVAFSFHKMTNQKLCYLSQYSCFPERLCAYAIISGQITTLKYLVEEMLHSLGVDYTYSFMDNMIARYGLKKRRVMTMYSVVYVGRKTKLEREFYFSHIQAWMENDKEEYLDAVSKMHGEWKRKTLAALRKAGLLDA